MSPYLITNNSTDFRGAGVSNRDDLDQLGIFKPFGFRGREGCLEINTPVGAKPDEALQSDDSATPNESPFGRVDVLVVERRGVIVTGENGPYYSEWPDIGMEIIWERGQELGALDLSIVHQGRRRHDDNATSPTRKGKRVVISNRRSWGWRGEPVAFED